MSSGSVSGAYTYAWSGGGTPIATAPSVSSAAAINDTSPLLGETLTGTATFSGTPTPTETSQWYRCTSPAASTSTSIPGDCTAISGATSATYAPTAADVGSYLRYSETATNSSGSAISLSAAATAVGMPSTGTPDLAAASDSGSSNTDNVTSDSTPTMDISGLTSGASVTVTATKAGSSSVQCTFTASGASGSCDPGTLSDGTWAVSATQTLGGMTSAASTSLNVTVDTTAPSAPGAPDLAASSDTGNSNTDNNTTDTTPTFSLSSGGTNGDTATISATNGSTTVSCTYTIGTGTQSCDLPTLTPGSWTVTGTLTDPAGNTSSSSSSLALTITTPPSAPTAPDLAAASDTGSSDTDNVTNDTTPTFSVSGGSSGNTATITATNGATTQSCTYTIGSANSCTLPTLTPGNWNVTGTIADAAGHTSSASSASSLTVDTTAPSAPGAPDLAASSDTGNSNTDNNTTDTTPTFSLSSGGTNGDTATISATNGSTTVSCTYTIGTGTQSCDLPTLTPGSWTVTGTLTDPAGNTSSSSSSLALTITTPPSAPGTAPDLASSSDTGTSSSDDITSDTTPTFTGSGGSSGNTVTISATSGATTRSCTYTIGTGTQSCDLPTLTAGSWNVTSTITDAAGNVSATSPAMSLTVDTSAPSAPGAPDLASASDTGSSPTDNITNDTTPAFSLSSGGTTGDTATISATNGSETKTCTYTIGTGTQSCDLPTLTPGSWTVTGTLTDPAGNTSSSSSSLALTVDTTAPSAPGLPDLDAASDTGESNTDNNTTDTTPTMSASGGSTGDLVTITASKGGTSVSCTYTVGTATSCDLPTMSGGTWNTTATFTDPAGNTSASSSPLSLVIDAPVSSGPSSSGGSGPSAPTAPDLLPSSDTGASNTDNVTSDTTPTLSTSGGTTGDTATITATNGTTTVSCSYVVGSATSCTLPPMTPGPWSVTGTLTDTAGNRSASSEVTNLTIDTSAPAAPTTPDLLASSDTGASSTDNVTSDTTPTLSTSGGTRGDTATITATNGSVSRSCTYTVGSETSCTLPTLGDGVWSVTGTLTDPAGNVSASSTPLNMTISTATAAPDLLASSDTGASNTDNITSDTTPSVRLPGGSSGDIATITATNGSVSRSCTYTVGSESACTLPTLAAGNWSLTGTFTDPSGTRTASSPATSITIDPTAPLAPIIPDLLASSDTGASNTDNITSDTTPAVSTSGGATGNIATISASNATTTRSCSYVVGTETSCTLPALTFGNWTVVATLTDAAGNVSLPSAPLNMTILAAPTAPDLLATSDTGASSTDNITSDTTPSMSTSGGSTGDTATITATNGITSQSCSYVIGTATSCNLPLLTTGTWSVTALLTKPNGEQSLSSPATNITIDRLSPTAPPAPDLLASSDTGASSTDNLTSDTTPAISALVGLNGETVTITATNGSVTRTCTYVVPTTSCTLPNLAEGPWQVTSTITDVAGNRSPSSPATKITISGATTPPESATTTTSSIARQPVVTTTIAALTPTNTTSPQGTTTTSSSSSTTTSTSTPPPLTDDDSGSDTSTPDAPLTASPRGAIQNGFLTVDVGGAQLGALVTVNATNGAQVVSCTFTASESVRGCLLDGLTQGVWSIIATSPGISGDSIAESSPFDISTGANDSSDNSSSPLPLDGSTTIALLASLLALAAIRQRSHIGIQRLNAEDREESGVASFAAGTGSGGLDMRSDFYRPPCSDRFDIGIRDWAHRISPLSPALGRSLDDGSYLRGIIGIFWPLLLVVAGVLGVMAARDTNYVVALPALALILALVIVGTLDATAGLVGSTTYGIAMLLGGGLDSADAIRGYLGLAGLMFLIGLVASAIRPYRRASVDDYIWNRIVDFILIPLLGAWAAGSIYKAIPHLSGYDTPWSDRVGTVELTVLLVLIARFGLENFARLAVSQRLRLIENEVLPEPSETQKTFSRLVRGGVFAFIAVVFVGANWWLVAGTVMFVAPKLVDSLTSRLPSSPRLYRLIPRNLVRIVAMLLVMHWWGEWVLRTVDTNEVQWAFVLMSVPGLGLGIVDWFARDGARWKSTPASRVLGVVVLLLGIAIVRGWIL